MVAQKQELFLVDSLKTLGMEKIDLSVTLGEEEEFLSLGFEGGDLLSSLSREEKQNFTNELCSLPSRLAP